MCDTTFSRTIPALITGVDIANANKYATMKLMRKKMEAYNATQRAAHPNTPDPLEWVNRYPGGKQTSYPCDFNNTNLNCYEGGIRIATKQECDARSHYTFDPFKPDNEANQPNAKNGWYLQWLPPATTKKENSEDGSHINVMSWDTSPQGIANGDCYMGNFIYRSSCETAFSDPEQPAPTFLIDKLNFDKTTGTCQISKSYCNEAGFNKYVDSNGNDLGSDKYGGTCELSGGQKVADFIGGNTFARGVVGGACPFKK